MIDLTGVRPVIVASCARLNTAHADRDLFGSEGLQSGRRVIGLFEQAHRGTLYFDEVCELPAAIQSRLVRTVAEQNFRRVGGNTEVSTDVRVISASSQDLQAAIADDVLREDLYYRLGVFPCLSRRFHPGVKILGRWRGISYLNLLISWAVRQ